MKIFKDKNLTQELIAQTVGELIIKWKASVTLKEGLQAVLHVKGKELWG
ncbi:hypothetical protein LCGC14_1293800 [marine sediment metagenome]|uniref:Uncharacterized protein n=1 Tax=marine sediment metagenome TaxID=412755 RepID=A0A0F9KRV2_9ZZZZ